MQRPTKHVAATAGLVALGALSGWSIPALMRAGHAAAASAADAGISINGAPSALPPGAAPNYHAIFQQNQAAVVSITTAGMTRVAEEQPDSGDLFGRGGPGDGSGDNEEGIMWVRGDSATPLYWNRPDKSA